MKFIRYINQNIPIWSMLDGDHALRNASYKINARLIIDPNFHVALDNQLRLDVFKSERQWILDTIGENCSFSIVKFTHSDLMKFQTCFSGISYKRFLNEHVQCLKSSKRNFSITGDKYTLEKPMTYIEKIKTMINTMKLDIHKSNVSNRVTHLSIDDVKQPNLNMWLAANRAILCKRKNGNIEILDGTHRLTCYGLLFREEIIQKSLFGFYCEE